MNLSNQNINWKYLLQETLLFLGFCYVFIFFNTNDDFLEPNLVLVSSILITVIGLVWLFRKPSQPTPLRLPIVIFLAVYLLATFFSIDIRRSLGIYYFVLIAFFFYAFFADLAARGLPAELVVKVILLVGAINSIFLWVQVGLWYQSWLQANPGEWLPSIIYRLPLPNAVAMYLNPLIFLSITRLFFTRTWPGRILLGVNIISLLGLSFLASSRSAWMGLAAGIFLIGIFTFQNQKQVMLKYWTCLKQRKILLIILTILVLLFGAIAIFILYKQTVHPTHGRIGSSRGEFWIPAWNTFLKYPLLGQGPDTFVSSRLTQYPTPPWGIFSHACNIYLNLLAETGVIGLIAFLWLLFQTIKALFRKIIISSLQEKTVVVAVLAMVVANILNGIFEGFQLAMMGSWTFLICLGTVMGTGQPEKPNGVARPWWVLALISVVWWYAWTLAPVKEGVDAANRNDWAGAVTKLEEAVKRDPYLAATHQQLGLAYSQQYAAGDSRALALAIEQFEKTVDLDPYLGLNHANLAALYLENGNMEHAIEEAQAAIERSSYSALFYLVLGQSAEAAGDADRAADAYIKALELQPGIHPAFFWRETELRQQVSNQWSMDHPVTPSSIEAAESAFNAEHTYVTNYLTLARVYLEAGENEKARVILERSATAYFSSNSERNTLSWLWAEYYSSQGDLEAATAWGQQALTGYTVGVFSDTGKNNDVVIYNQIVFFRPAMTLELVPQLVVIPMTDPWGERAVELGDWYLQMGNTHSACTWYLIVFENIPDLSGLQGKIESLPGCSY